VRCHFYEAKKNRTAPEGRCPVSFFSGSAAN
jgi:hypothetical protein